ncbi:MAG: RidA family protein [Pseudomonadota bacterium]
MPLKALTLDDQIGAHREGAAHAMEVPANARLLFCNGQVGMAHDGGIPDTVAAQVEIVFERLARILRAASMGFADVVRLTVYVTSEAFIDDYVAARARHLKDHNPPTILLLVDRFPRAGIKVEIEAVAAKVDERADG